MAVWFTADTHLGHANIVRFCSRPFLSPREQELLAELGPHGKWRVSAETLAHHDTALLANINACVQPEDTLWIVGDFCWGGLPEALRYRRRILCRTVHLIWGNHDQRSIASAFQQTYEQTHITVEGVDLFLNHYPMRTWYKSFHGSWSVYGHVHGRLQAEDQRDVSRLTRDVGVDACGYRPISFGELAEYMAPRLEHFHARRAAVLAGADGEL
jgi:calcineurin-like phosphoesterase family protein